MAIQIVRNDITKMDVDVIVNPANCELKAGGGCCGAIYRAAGRELDKATAALGGCDVGDAKITYAFDLPSKFIVHTVGPMWIDGKHNEPELLASCYAKSLKIAFEAQCKSIAFPLISSGIFGYPKDRALQVAWQAISQFLLDHEMAAGCICPTCGRQMSIVRIATSDKAVEIDVCSSCRTVWYDKSEYETLAPEDGALSAKVSAGKAFRREVITQVSADLRSGSLKVKSIEALKNVLKSRYHVSPSDSQSVIQSLTAKKAISFSNDHR